ncbi:hypothetical protein pb186bvf_018980 [Paramecium bursaria]
MTQSYQESVHQLSSQIISSYNYQYKFLFYNEYRYCLYQINFLIFLSIQSRIYILKI